MIRAMWLGLLLSLAACSTQAPNVITLTPKGRNVIEINNSSFHDSVSIEGGKALYNGDLLECVVTMRCHEDENVDFEYYWEFYDADGFIMDDTTALWSPVTHLACAEHSASFEGAPTLDRAAAQRSILGDGTE